MRCEAKHLCSATRVFLIIAYEGYDLKKVFYSVKPVWPPSAHQIFIRYEYTMNIEQSLLKKQRCLWWRCRYSHCYNFLLYSSSWSRSLVFSKVVANFQLRWISLQRKQHLWVSSISCGTKNHFFKIWIISFMTKNNRRKLQIIINKQQLFL